MSRRCEPGQQPPLGFHLVAWDKSKANQVSLLMKAVDELAGIGIRRLTLPTFRFVDRNTGVISAESQFGAPSGLPTRVLSEIASKALQAGLDVGIYPYIEIDDGPEVGSIWRGTLDFSDVDLPQFFQSYTDYVSEIASVSSRIGTSRVYLGSELAALTSNPKALSYWEAVIRHLRKVYPRTKGELLYAAHHEEYMDFPLWGQLDGIGINAYFPLVEEANATGPDQPTVDVLIQSWEGILSELRSFARSKRKQISFTEWGAVPYDLTTSKPWSPNPSSTEDRREQQVAFSAMLKAVCQEKEWLKAIDIWHWKVPDSSGSPYSIDIGSPVVTELRDFCSGRV